MTTTGMTTTDINATAIATTSDAVPKGEPVFMLNLLRYRSQADYGDQTNQPAMSGREAYHRNYRAAFGAIADGTGVRVAWYGPVHAVLASPANERWDEMAIVEYPDFATFRRIVESPRYRVEADHHRRAALEDWRLIAIGRA